MLDISGVNINWYLSVVVILANNHCTTLPSDGITPDKRIEGRERGRGRGRKEIGRERESGPRF